MRGGIVRYHVLRATATFKKIGLCIGFLAASYTAAALINASPVIQPALKSNPRIIVVSPPTTPDEAPLPTSRPESELAPNSSARHSL